MPFHPDRDDPYLPQMHYNEVTMRWVHNACAQPILDEVVPIDVARQALADGTHVCPGPRPR